MFVATFHTKKIKSMNSRTLKFLSILFLAFAMIVTPTGASYAKKKKKKSKKKEQKELRKKWKKKAKAYIKNPLALKAREEAYEKQIQELTTQNQELTEQVAQLQGELDKLKGELSAAESRIKSCEAEKERLKTAYEAQKQVTTKNIEPGLVYKVQIGAFKYFDINKYLQDNENFKGETQDGLNKYVIGKFKDYEVATAFKKDIRRMGIRDAWVVPYIDGVRVTMAEAKRYIQQQGATTIPSGGATNNNYNPASNEGTDF